MTAYVHIGTPKTGTTSIQAFMGKNDENWLKKGFVYSKSIRRGDHQHWGLVTLANIHCLEAKSEQQKLFYQEKIEKLKQEIKENKDKIFIFSTEGLTWALNLTQVKPVKALKDLLYSLGFNDIKIILYLRSQADLMVSMSSQNIKSHHTFYTVNTSPSEHPRTPRLFDFKNIIQKYGEVFGKENLNVRLFNKNEFKDGDLLKDFVDAIGLEWDDSFIIPENKNETLDLIGFELGKRINSHFKDQYERNLYGLVLIRSPLYFSSKDKDLKFMPPKEVYQSYIDYFEESNEWVRKEFFPHKERLFPKKDLTNYKENYELKEMKPEYWDRIAKFIADFAENRKKIIDDKDKIINQKDQIIQTKNQELTSKNQELESKIQQLTQTKNQLDSTKKELDSKVKQMDSQIKNLESNQKQSNLKIQRLAEANQQLTQTNSQLNLKTKELDFTLHYGTAKSRIHNHLSYKLGETIIENSKSLLGYIRMPYVLSYIKDKHKQEQQQYQETIKKNPNLKLPNLESYPDYKESLKEKECFTYKLGEAFIKANTAGGGGAQLFKLPLTYFNFAKEVRKLRRELKEKRKY